MTNFKTGKQQNLHDLWDTMKKANLQIMHIHIEEHHVKSKENIFNTILAEYFPNLGGGEGPIYVQKVNR